MKSQPPNRKYMRAGNTIAAHSLPGADDILRVRLENDITVLARPNFNSPSVVIQGYLQTGSLLDPDEKLGLANFTAAGLMRGAAGQDFQAIYDSLESIGASLSFSSGTLSTSFGGKALAEDLQVVLGVLGQVLAQPEFPPAQIERLRAQYMTSLALRAQDTAAMSALKFDALRFAGHPYSRPEDGYPETVSAIQREDLIRFHELTYGPKGMVIVITGGIEPNEAVDKVNQALSGWVNPRQEGLPPLPPVHSPPGVRREHTTIAGKSQADLTLGVLAPERRSSDFLPLAVANDILGQFGLYGRIGESVREKAGLAYYAYSSLNAGLGPGAWYASAGVDPNHIDQAIDLIAAEFRLLAKEPVSAEELADTQTNFIGRLPLGLESNAGVAVALMYLERHALGLDYYREYPALVRAVTQENVLLAAGKYLIMDELVIATAGPGEARG